MKLSQVICKVPLVASILLLSGCSLTSDVTKEDVARYQNIKDFFYDRLISKSLFDGVKSERNKDGSISYLAYFSGDVSSLKKPKEILEGYCKVRGGEMVAIEKMSLDVLSPYRNRLDRIDEERRQLAKLPLPSEARAKLYSDLVMEETTVSQIANAYSRNANFSWDQDLLFRLGKEGYFGYFICSLNGEKWLISIVPVSYRPGSSSNMLITSTLLMRLRVDKLEDSGSKAGPAG